MQILVRFARGFGSLLLAAAVAAAALPWAARAHCASATSDLPAHHQHQAPDAPAPGGDCPHCPPSQCAAQTHCSAAVELALAQPAGATPVSNPPPAPFGGPVAWDSHAPEPVPPPPQPRA